MFLFSIATLFSSLMLSSVMGKMDFVLRNCGSTDFLELKSGTTSPYPILVPGTQSVSGEVEVKQKVAGRQFEVDVTIQSYVGFLWITIPCISNVGSCTYDPCKEVAKITANGCPPQLTAQNIPCKCDDFAPGTYKLNDAKFVIPELSGIWSWLASGDYKATITLKDKTDHSKLACLHAEVTVADGNACSGFLCSIFG